MSLILKQESIGNVPTPVAGKSVVFVDTTGQLGVKQSSGTTVVTGNITAVNLDGNVSNVLSGTGTWIAAGSGSSYGDSNVVTLMSNFGSNTIVTTGNITAGNLITSGASGNISGANVISATTLSASGNVISGNIQVGSYLTLQENGNISGAGGVSVFYLNSSGGVSTSALTVSATANLGSVGNVIITGGASGQVLSTDGAGNLSWATQSGGSANLESVSTDVLPSFDSVFDLGSTTKRWDNLNLATSANINGSVLTGTTVGNSATLTTNAVLVADSVVATSALLGDVSIISNTISALDYYGNVGTLSVVGNIAVGNVANVIIPGGTSGQVLSTDGSGGLSWATAGGGAGLAGTSYVYVAGNGTAAENGAELVAAYATAKTMTPFGSPLSNTNRVIVVVAPGTYTATFTVDALYVDVVSLTGAMDVKLSNINVTSYNCRLYGLDLGTNPFTCSWTVSDVNVFEKCRGGDYSFGYTDTIGVNVVLSGTYTNCTAGNFSFGSINAHTSAYPTLSGTFTECTAGYFGFGFQDWTSSSNGPLLSGKFIRCSTTGSKGFGYVNAADTTGGPVLSGTFIDCYGLTDQQFGGGSYATLSGTFNNCYVIGNYGFGHSANNGVLSGKFENCYTTGTDSFGSSNFGGLTLSGTFVNCSADGYSFGNSYFAGVNIISGIFINCTSAGPTNSGTKSFGVGANSTVSGTFRNCNSGNFSFGWGAANMTGTFINCSAGNSSFGWAASTVTDGGTGVFIGCSAGTGSFLNGNGVSSTLAGFYKDCRASDESFGRYGTCSGTFINCTGGSTSFERVTGTLTSCIAGSGSFGSALAPTGKMYYCRLTSGTFPTVGSGGRTIYCIDGNNNTNNQ